MIIKPDNNRHCFKQEGHSMHPWPHQVTGPFWCEGQGIDPDTQKVKETPENKLNLAEKFCLEDDPHMPHTHKHKDFLYWCTGEGWDAIEASEPPFKEKDYNVSEGFKDAAQKLLDSRRAVYGDRVRNMERTAELWSALLGFPIEDWQVPLMMSAYKMLRTFETPDYSDNSDDIDGWKKMFVEVMDANHGGIIQARTVEEYQAIKNKKIGDERGIVPPHIQTQMQEAGTLIDAWTKRPINTRDRGGDA